MGYTPFNCKLGAFTGSQNFIPSALSAKTVAVMAHNKGLELGADMVLLLKGGWVCGGEGGDSEITLSKCELSKVSYN